MNAFLSGGYTYGKSLNSTEVLNPKTFKRCLLPELPTNRFFHTQVGNRTNRAIRKGHGNNLIRLKKMEISIDKKI